jgi:hypothetical protein
MVENSETRKKRFAWFFGVEVFALLLIVLYYVIIEHTGHLIEYAGLITFVTFVLFLVIVWFGFFPREKNDWK